MFWIQNVKYDGSYENEESIDPVVNYETTSALGISTTTKTHCFLTISKLCFDDDEEMIDPVVNYETTRALGISTRTTEYSTLKLIL